jgi:cyclopropane fatty-acyl-phospholipid synthase-like methyltransferase
MVEWFEEWFNTEEYLEVYSHRNEKDAGTLVNLILKKVKLQPNAKVLDMACGAGRHAILFAEKGFNVTAVDLSNNLLKVAEKAAVKAEVEINFVKEDLRKFRIEQNFDLIVNLFTSFGYFQKDEDNFKLFKNVYQHLNKNGYFVLDYFNENYLRKNLISKSETKINDTLLIQERRIEGERIVKEITLANNGTEKRFFESVRMYGKAELIKNLKSLGFTIKKVFGDFTGEEFDLETSPRIIIIALK